MTIAPEPSEFIEEKQHSWFCLPEHWQAYYFLVGIKNQHPVRALASLRGLNQCQLQALIKFYDVGLRATHLIAAEICQTPSDLQQLIREFEGELDCQRTANEAELFLSRLINRAYELAIINQAIAELDEDDEEKSEVGAALSCSF